MATDGHRLSKARTTWSGPFIPMKVILRAKLVTEMKPALAGAESAAMGCSATHAFVRIVSAGGATLTFAAKRIEAEYPPYDQVIPKRESTVTEATADIAELIAVMKAASAFCSEQRGCTITFADGTLRVNAKDPDGGECFATVDSATQEGPEVKIGINPAYVLEVLRGLDPKERVRLRAQGELDPMCIDGDVPSIGFVGVIMPMRI